ncbi:MAG: hypothetical protein ACKN9T_19320 [Candidatus Methylumidiphilus sp.]
MAIKVVTVESSAWNADNINHALVLGEFADESEALTEIWRDLVEKREHRAYLIFRINRWVKFWQKPTSIVWGGLYHGVPRIYQEPMGVSAGKKAAKVYSLTA